MKTFFIIAMILGILQSANAFLWMGDDTPDPLMETKTKYEYVILHSGGILSSTASVEGMGSKSEEVTVFKDEDIRFRFTSERALTDEMVKTLLSEGKYVFWGIQDIHEEKNPHPDYDLLVESIDSRVSMHLIEKKDGTYHAEQRLNQITRTVYPGFKGFAWGITLILVAIFGCLVTWYAFGAYKEKKGVDLALCLGAILLLVHLASLEEYAIRFVVIFFSIPVATLLVKLWSDYKEKKRKKVKSREFPRFNL